MKNTAGYLLAGIAMLGLTGCGCQMRASGTERAVIVDTVRAPHYVYFPFDTAELTPAAKETIRRNYELFREQDARLEIEGHADERGTDEYNKTLSRSRAEAVRNYLVSLGMAEDDLEIVGFGEDFPAQAQTSEEAWAKNRRVQFTVRQR